MESLKKPPVKAMAYPDAQSAVDGVLEAWLPRLIESNELLMAALIKLRECYLTGTPPDDAGEALARAKAALEQAAMVQKGSLVPLK
jgi:hypothetical protein